jgi:hypothetical protein
MSRTNELDSPRQHDVDTVVPTGLRKRRLDWAILVVMVALGSTLGWVSLLLWGAMRAFQIALL